MQDLLMSWAINTHMNVMGDSTFTTCDNWVLWQVLAFFLPLPVRPRSHQHQHHYRSHRQTRQLAPYVSFSWVALFFLGVIKSAVRDGGYVITWFPTAFRFENVGYAKGVVRRFCVRYDGDLSSRLRNEILTSMGCRHPNLQQQCHITI